MLLGRHLAERWALALLIGLVACSHQGGDRYRDQSGWTADIPDDWHVLAFDTTKGDASSSGTQISNVELPSPRIDPGLPIQVSGLDLAPDGVAIIIATDDDPSNVQKPPVLPAKPPLSMTEFDVGSSTGGGPSLSLLWFSCGGEPLLLSLKEGSSPSSGDRASAQALIRSLRCETDG